MSRLKLKFRNRCKFFLSLPFVMALTALFLGGINVTSAGADQSNKHHAKNSHEYHAIRDPKIDPNLSPANRARVQRDASIKNRQNARKFIQSVVEGKDAASSQGWGAK